MMKKLDKKLVIWMVAAVVILVVLGVVIFGIATPDSKKAEEAGNQIGTEHSSDGSRDDEDKEGLTVLDEVDENVNRIDASGSWD